MNNPKEELNNSNMNYLFDFIKLLNDNWHHYDSHVWQIPSVALAINGFLIAQAFSEELENFSFVCEIVVLISVVFTLVLLFALVNTDYISNHRERIGLQI